MPEIKHTFTGGKMNKSLDERLVPNGEYRDALNVQVRTTDGNEDGIGDAGSVQNIEGNYRIGSSFGDYANQFDADTQLPIWEEYTGALRKVSVGSVADEKNNNAYFFFACQESVPQTTADVTAVTSKKVYVDSIIEQNTDLQTTPVIVDNYAIVDTYTNFLGNGFAVNFLVQGQTTGFSGISNELIPNYPQYRNEGTLKFYNNTGLILTTKLKSVTSNSVNFETGHEIDFTVDVPTHVVFEIDRVLKFDSSKKISAINIIEDLLFFTDGNSEPKKINIKNCKLGTASYYSHTILKYINPLDSTSSNPLSTTGTAIANIYNVDAFIKEENVTVIRRAPKTPPTVEVDIIQTPSPITVSTSFNSVDTNTNPFTITEYQEEAIISITDGAFVNSDNVYLSGDTLVFSNTSYEQFDESAFNVTCKFISYLDSSGDVSFQPTNSVSLEIISISDPNGFNSTTGVQIPFNVEFETSNKKPLFELKFPRFGYRYQYVDGEYSSFSPFSKVAFEPGEFDYSPIKGYNLGMVNTIRKLTIKDFIPFITDIGLDVKAVEILYKETNSPNVYTIKNIKRDISPEWQNNITTNGTYLNEDVRPTGKITITSEMIHRVLPSNQILRAYDNVPRFAKAQDVTGNRLVYGNYIQGYKINNQVDLLQRVESKEIEGNVATSVKSIRNYKFGMVFGDIYGRETPVIASGVNTGDEAQGDSLTGDIVVDKSLCALSNRFILRQDWKNGDPLDWMDYVKYYVKETTSEYYNLVMDRWYYAENKDNIWLSFPSADRNKVDEETYLLLKNQHGASTPVLDKARYKIIAIENEAPDFIKIDERVLGRLELDTTDLGSTGNVITGDPINLISPNTSILINANEYEGFLDNYKFQNRGDLKFRIVGQTGASPNFTEFVHGEWVTVTNFNLDIPGNFIFHWNEPFALSEVDMDTIFTNNNLSFANGKYFVEFKEDVVTNKPEFDGRFFVLIEKDIVVQENVEVVSGSQTQFVESPDAKFEIGYIDTQKTNPAVNGTYANYNWGDDGAANDYMNDDFVSGNDYYVQYFGLGCLSNNGGIADLQASGGFGAGTANFSLETKKFWQNYKQASVNAPNANIPMNLNRVFLDGAMAREWNIGEVLIDGQYSRFNYKPTALDQGGAEDGTMGRMVISQQAAGYETAPGSFSNGNQSFDILDDNGDVSFADFLQNKLQPENYFSFVGDPNNNVYQIISTQQSIYVSNYNRPYQQASDNGSFAQLLGGNIGEFGEFCCTDFPYDYGAEQYGDGCLNCLSSSDWCNRTSYRIEFRKVNDDGTLSNEGVDINGNFGNNAFDPRGSVRHDGLGFFEIQFKDKVLVNGSIVVPEKDRAVWETEPKDDVNLELYYSASHAIPMNLRKGNTLSFAPLDSTVSLSRYLATGETIENNLNFDVLNTNPLEFSNVKVKDVFYSTNPVVNIVSQTNNGTIASHDVNIGVGDNLVFTHKNGIITTTKVLNHIFATPAPFNTTLTTQAIYPLEITWTPVPNIQDLVTVNDTTNISTGVNIVGAQFGGAFGFGGIPTGLFLYNFGGANPIRITDTSWMTQGVTYYVFIQQPTGFYEIDPQVWKYPVNLNWFNCYSFGNGVESDRIRDDFNAPQLDNGVRVSTTLTNYTEEKRTNSIIHSGIYNSTSSVNDLNEFNMAEKITKDLNPSYGSIQALKTRDTDLVVFTEDKVLKVLSNKDALFNADGNPQLTATDRVLGTAVPFVGDYGISKNPESLSWDQYRMYFTDKQRGAVLRLSRDGLTPISNVGMKTWFRENLEKTNIALGTFDKVSGEYNLSLDYTDDTESTTVSFNEGSKGWTSFKSFVPDSGVSVAGKYMTSKNGLIWQHYWKEYEDDGVVDTLGFLQNGSCLQEGLPIQYNYCKERNNFYDVQYDSTIDVLFNDIPGSVKSFQTMNYEGSQSRVLQNLDDDKYYNLNSKFGWYVESFETDMQSGKVPEFINKENKWFNNICGTETELSNLDTTEFSVQGIGVMNGSVLPVIIDEITQEVVLPDPDPCIVSVVPYVNGQVSYSVAQGQVVTFVITTNGQELPQNFYGEAGTTWSITADSSNGFPSSNPPPQLSAVNTLTGNEPDNSNVFWTIMHQSVTNSSNMPYFPWDGTPNQFDFIQGQVFMYEAGPLAEDAADLQFPNTAYSDIVITDNGSLNEAWADANDPIYNSMENPYSGWSGGGLVGAGNIGGNLDSTTGFPTQINVPIYINPMSYLNDTQEEDSTFTFNASYTQYAGAISGCNGEQLSVDMTLIGTGATQEIIPQPTYLSLTSSVNGVITNNVTEGDTVVFTLTAANISTDTTLVYNIFTGNENELFSNYIDVPELGSTSAGNDLGSTNTNAGFFGIVGGTQNATQWVNNGNDVYSCTISYTVTEDNLTEGEEFFTLSTSIADSNGVTSGLALSTSVHIQDTSLSQGPADIYVVATGRITTELPSGEFSAGTYMNNNSFFLEGADHNFGDSVSNGTFTNMNTLYVLNNGNLSAASGGSSLIGQQAIGAPIQISFPNDNPVIHRLFDNPTVLIDASTFRIRNYIENWEDITTLTDGFDVYPINNISAIEGGNTIGGEGSSFMYVNGINATLPPEVQAVYFQNTGQTGSVSNKVLMTYVLQPDFSVPDSADSDLIKNWHLRFLLGNPVLGISPITQSYNINSIEYPYFNMIGAGDGGSLVSEEELAPPNFAQPGLPIYPINIDVVHSVVPVEEQSPSNSYKINFILKVMNTNAMDATSVLIEPGQNHVNQVYQGGCSSAYSQTAAESTLEIGSTGLFVQDGSEYTDLIQTNNFPCAGVQLLVPYGTNGGNANLPDLITFKISGTDTGLSGEAPWIIAGDDNSVQLDFDSNFTIITEENGDNSFTTGSNSIFANTVVYNNVDNYTLQVKINLDSNFVGPVQSSGVQEINYIIPVNIYPVEGDGTFDDETGQEDFLGIG